MINFKNFVSVKWLSDNLHKKNLVIIDCRGDLLNSEYGFKVYCEGHIEGAVFIDLKKDLSSEEKEHGGRNPVPSIQKFKQVIENFGIDNETLVVAYDEQKIASAARVCWMLRYIGHNNNYVLNGGLNKWVSAGYGLSIEKALKIKSIFNIKINEDIKADREEVKASVENKNKVIVYCGSGVDAAFNFILLDEINIKSKLYVGSWSDWITY